MMVDNISFEYSKEWMETFLDISYIENEFNYVDTRIMMENRIKSILSIEVKPLSSGNVYRYKVTGFKTVNMTYANVPIKLDNIITLINGIIHLCDLGKEYLLREDGFLIDGDFVFLDRNTGEPYFVYLPGYSEKLSVQLGNFLQKLLNMVDYSEREAVDLLYRCYSAVVKDNQGLTELKKIILSQETMGTGSGQIVNNKDEILNESNKVQYGKKDESADWVNDIRMKDKQFTEEKAGFLSWFRGRRKKKENQIPWDVYTAGVGETKKEEIGIKDIESDELEEHTVFLSVKHNGGRAYLLNISTNEMFSIDKKRFVLGSNKEYTDLHLDYSGISRLHAVITEENGQYFVEDLNSTNGSWHNGHVLMPGKAEELLSNDRIKLADTEFVFKK